ncbi:MAG: hypothetical protein ACLPVF_09590 [Acidimicrobiales bacterium]
MKEATGAVTEVMVGSVLECRADVDAWPELEESWQTIVSSEEVRDLVSGGLSLARDLLGRQAEMLAGVLGVSDADTTLRQAA